MPASFEPITQPSPVMDFSNLNTKLEPDDENNFLQWKQQNAPDISGLDYDLRGAYKAGATPDVNGQWPDEYKKPNNPTFSDKSNFASQYPEVAGTHDENGEFVPSPIQRTGGLSRISDSNPSMVGKTAAIDKKGPSWGDVLHSDFEQNNWVAGAFNHVGFDVDANGRPDLNYNPVPDIPMDLRDYAARYVSAKNEGDTAQVTQRIRDELANKQTLADAGTVQNVVSSLAVGLTDPLTYVPVGDAYKLYKTGGRILDGAARTATIGGLTSTAEEMIDHNTQYTRQWDESAQNIGAATVLSGLLGGVGGYFSHGEYNKALDGINNEFNINSQILPKEFESSMGKYVFENKDTPIRETLAADAEKAVAPKAGDDTNVATNEPAPDVDVMAKPVDSYANIVRGDDSVGAKSLRMTAEDRRYSSALGLEKLVSYQSPDLDIGFNSLSESALKGASQLWESPLNKNYYKEGVTDAGRAGGTAEETLPVQKLVDAKLANVYNKRLRLQSEVYPKYLERVAEKEGGKKPLNIDQFKDEIGWAMHNGDKHPIPEVAEMARDYRKDLDDRLALSKETGYLGKDVEKPENSESYFPVQWNRVKLAAHSKQFADEVIYPWLKKERIDENLAEHELRDLSYEITNNMAASPEGRMRYDNEFHLPTTKKGVGTRSAWKPRKLNVDPSVYRDWTVLDAPHVMERSAKPMYVDMYLAKKFGDPSLSGLKKDIHNDYDGLIQSAKNDKEVAALNKRRAQDIKKITGVASIMRGDYSKPNGLAQMAMAFNYTTSLSQMTLSSLNDIARPIMTHSLMPALSPILKGFTDGFKDLKLAKTEMKRADMAFSEMGVGLREGFHDMMEDYSYHSALHRVMNYGSELFTKMTLIRPWTRMVKTWQAAVVREAMFDAAARVTKGAEKAKDIQNLAASYIDKSDAAKVVEQVEKNGKDLAGWTDPDLVMKFRAGMTKDVNRSIITPDWTGAYKSLWMSKNMGKLAAQFNGFTMDSVAKTMLYAGQKRDFGTVFGLGMSTAIGAAIYAAKANLNGYKADYTPQNLIAEGLDRSGGLGWFFNANNVLEKASRGHLGIGPLIGKQGMTRYNNVSLLGALAGPTGDLVDKAGKVAGATSDYVATGKPFSQADKKAVQRVVPFSGFAQLLGAFQNK